MGVAVAYPARVPAALRIRQIPLSPMAAGDLGRWRELTARAVEPNPFFEPAFALPAVRRLGEHGTSLFVVEDGDGWRACLPVQRARFARVVPGLRTWKHLYCFLGTPLLAAEVAPSAARSLLEAVVQPGRQLMLESLGEGGHASVALRQAADELGLVTVHEATHDRALLERRPAGDYLDKLRSHRRRELNRLGRRLESELGGALAVSDESGSDAALDRFLELERSGWKGRGATALGSSPAHAGFFRDVCRAFSAEGRLQLLSLSAGGRCVAMKCNVSAGDGAFCFKIAYDEQLARFSPGVQLERENIRIFHEGRSEQWQDSCADPENTMINRLWPDRRRIRTVLFARRGALAAVSRQGIKVAQSIREIERKRSSPPS